MKMQLLTAIKISELIESALETADGDEVTLADTAEALMRDAIARQDLQNEIDGKS